MRFWLSYFKSSRWCWYSGALNMPANLESSEVATRLEEVSFHSKKCSNYCTVVLISHASKVTLIIIQARLQQHVNQDFPDVQAGFKKEDPEIKLPTSPGSLKKQEFQKNIYFCFIDYSKAFDWVDHSKLWKLLKEMGISEHLTCLLRNLYAGQDATFRTRHGTMDWLQIGKGVHQGCILSPCLFNLYAKYIMQNARLDEAQAGIKMPGEISITSDMQMTPSLWQKVKKK